MAIYHLEVSHVSKANGSSASAKSDYALREEKYAQDITELVQDGHAYMLSFALSEPHDFWKAADQNERSNTQACSEIRIALPSVLDKVQRAALI